jgi:hypothetical protein
MRNMAFLFLACICLPAFAAEAVTVAQLEKTLAAAHGKSDASTAQRLSELELTERLSSAKLAYWNAKLRGDKAQQALIALADASAFLDPPAAEIPLSAAPDPAAQQKMISMAAEYVSETMPRLPNLLATRETRQFQNHFAASRTEEANINVAPRFHFVGSSSATVLYRDGQEVLDHSLATDAKEAGKPPQSNGLVTWGEFGHLLGTVMGDALQGKLTWSHWELGAAGPMAVFRYAVPLVKSHYEVKQCCALFDDGMSGFNRIPGSFDQVPAYHGEIAIDPVTGAVLRLVLQRELQPSDPIVRADVVVEYGPVEIGGKTYICPVKSISISKSPIREGNGFWYSSSTATGLEKTAINDYAFDNYHLFRGDARILTGNTIEPDKNAPASSPASGVQSTHP